MNSDIDYSLIALDLAGHGNSEHTGCYTIADFKTQILTFMEDIEDDVLLVGNSFGGHLAMEVANDVFNLKGILICGAPPLKSPINFDEAFIPVEETRAFYEQNPGIDLIDRVLDIAAANKSVIPVLKADFLKTDPLIRSSLAVELSNPDAFANELEIWTNLSCKKFILNGDMDPIINVDYIESICSKNATELIICENCGHYPSLEKSEEFNDQLRRIADIVFS